jgi:hypothetical protein
MATFRAQIDETVHTSCPPEAARARLADPAFWVSLQDRVQSTAPRPDGGLDVVLVPQAHGGVGFHPRLSLRWSSDAAAVRWGPPPGSDGNVQIEAEVQLSPGARGGTVLRWVERTSADLPLPRLALPVLGPVVERMMAAGLRATLAKARERLDAIGG